MSKNSQKYTWDINHGQCPPLEEHSEAKHIILSEYIQKYLNIVCQSRRIPQYNITLVDGFAGGGVYQSNKPGSPLVMIEAVRKADFEINKDRSKRIEIEPEYFFIEKNTENYESLKDTVNKKELEGECINLKHGDFNLFLPEIISHIKKRNPCNGGGSIFFLDQTGYSAVSIKTLNLIRRELPKAEIIINISVSWLIDFINDKTDLENTISKMGLTNFIDLNEIIDLKANIKDHRYIIESKLSVALQQAAQFPYFRPFFIQPHNNHRGYWLLHLAPHYRAHNAMSEVIWSQGNCMRHYGGDGARIFDLSYKGGVIDIPDIFGNTFNGTARRQHLDGLIRDLPDIIWNFDSIKVSNLIELTCNNTAASQEMYLESIAKMRGQKDLLIRGKGGGKKRSNTICPSDRIIPNKQLFLFT